MKRTSLMLLLCLLLSILLCAPASAQTPAPAGETEREQAILDRLMKTNPAAVPLFRQAKAAGDAGDYLGAKMGYEQVLFFAPDFPDALRRLSYAESYLGNAEAAVILAERAVNLDDSPYNHMALAQALLSNGDQSDDKDGLQHAQKAALALPDDYDAHVVWALAAGRADDRVALRQAVERLLTLAPDDPSAHYLAGLSYAGDQRWEQAERELLRARDLGMTPDMVQTVLDDGVASQARLYRWLRRLGYAFAGWIGGLLLLFAAGAILSRLTLTAVRRTQASSQFAIGPGEKNVRALYRVVILLTSLAFYISIPFLILIILAIAAGVIYLFFVIGRVPLRLVVFIGVGALLTLYAVVRSLFTRIQETEPGRPVGRDEAPALWSLTEEVASRVDTRPVDAIYITPAPEIAVMERGGFWQKLRGAGQRYLILGLGALAGLNQGQLKAILAHEYGHFSNRDTAGGDLAFQTRASMYHMAYRLAAGGQARWYNPAWLFINGYYRLFLRITQGASRLQEILADRFAAIAYGARTFADGLLQIVRQTLLFGAQVDVEIARAPLALNNLYSLPALADEQQQQLEEKLDALLKETTSPYASHPAVGERIALLERLEVAGSPAEAADGEPAWNLLPPAQQLQAEMTAIVQENVRQAQES